MNKIMTLDRQLEAVLFYKASPVKTHALAKIFGVTEAEISRAAGMLRERLQDSALVLIVTDDDLEIAVRPEFDSLIEGLRRDEMRRDIGKAGAETLAIVLYRSPVTRTEVDRVRGVNSSYILRSLETRGLIERRGGARQVEFIPTTELLRHLGISEKTELPDYATVLNALENYERQGEEEELTESR